MKCKAVFFKASPVQPRRNYCEVVEKDHWRCHYCDDFVVGPGEERAAHWAHNCEETKNFGISEMVSNGLCPKTAVPRKKPSGFRESLASVED